MDRWAEINTFIMVVEEAGFAPAAKRLGVAPSSVSRLIASLETRLDVRLMNRTTRRFTLTDAGEMLYLQGRKALHLFEEAEAEARGISGSITGHLSLFCDAALTQTIMPLLQAAQKAAPDLSVTIGNPSTTQSLEDMDLLLTIARAPEGLRTRQLAEFDLCTVASAAYLQRQAPIQSPADLQRHNCITQAGDGRYANWLFHIGTDEAAPVHVQGQISTDSLINLHHAVLGGLGIAQLPRFMVQKGLTAHQLVEILPDYRSAHKVPFYACYPNQPQTPVKTRMMLDLLSEAFAQE